MVELALRHLQVDVHAGVYGGRHVDAIAGHGDEAKGTGLDLSDRSSGFLATEVESWHAYSHCIIM